MTRKPYDTLVIFSMRTTKVFLQSSVLLILKTPSITTRFHHRKESEEKVKRKFQDISEAYYILSDPILRKDFDRETHHHPVVALTTVSNGKLKSVWKKGKNYRRIISTPYPI